MRKRDGGQDGKVEENLDSLKGCFLIKPFRVPNTLKKGQKVWNLKRLGLKIESLFLSFFFFWL